MTRDDITRPRDDDEEFTRERVTTLLLEVMDWIYAEAHRERPMTKAEQKALEDIRTALAAESTVKDSLTAQEALRRENERLQEALQAETDRCAEINEAAAQRCRDAGWDSEATALRDAAEQMRARRNDESAIWRAVHDPRG